MNSHYDVIVVGGGPAGSTAAAIVAQAGFTTLLVEREKMPRFHVGESLMPETYWTLKRIGALQKMKRSQFIPKRSVQFVSHSGKESQPFFFRAHDPRECSQTWQVERAEFDQMLFENAAERGAECRDRSRVIEVLLDDRTARGVRLQVDQAPVRDIESRVVIDATGQQALIANRLGLRVDDPDLRKAAIWGYYRGGHRDPGENAGATVILHTKSKQSWFWYIPLKDDVISVGVVSDREFLFKDRGKPEQVFEEELANCPAVCERLAGAQLVSRLHVAREFSYSTSQHAGDGWVLVGDAFGFIDPIYSSGVFFALKTAEMAADCAVEGLNSGDTSAAQLGAWTDQFNSGSKWIRKLVNAFYTNPFSFGSFMSAHPHHLANLTDLLIGRIFHDNAGSIFEDMDPWLESSRTTE